MNVDKSMIYYPEVILPKNDRVNNVGEWPPSCGLS